MTFLKDGKHFIWTSEKSGYNHVYRYDMTGKLVNQITKGDYDVMTFYGVDEANGKIYYQAAAVNPMAREVYVVNIDGKKNKKLTKQSGSNSARFSKTFDYFIHTHSTITEPNTYTVRNRKGKEVRVLELRP